MLLAPVLLIGYTSFMMSKALIETPRLRSRQYQRIALNAFFQAAPALVAATMMFAAVTALTHLLDWALSLPSSDLQVLLSSARTYFLFNIPMAVIAIWFDQITRGLQHEANPVTSIA